MTEKARQTITLQQDGRSTVTGDIRKAVDINGKKAYCKVEEFGNSKVLLTILHRCDPFQTLEIGSDGRFTLPVSSRETIGLKDKHEKDKKKRLKKAFAEVENVGPDKILITVMTRWVPDNRSPFKDVVKKQ